MRPAVLVGIALVAWPTQLPAQPGPYLANVTDPEVKLRAGPSDQFPETGSLRQGARVVVDHEEPNGWLAVAAPQGAVSWLPAQFLDGFDAARPLPQNVVVQADGEVTLAVGRVGLSQPLEIRRVKVPDGTILAVIGGKVSYAGKTWYPVAPPPGDFRYLPKSAIQADRAINTSFVVRGGDSVTPASAPGALTVVANGTRPGEVGKPVVNNPLWAQAEAAEKDGRYDDAERLFFQLARAMNEPGGDHDVANLCYSRIHSLREKKRPIGSGPPTGPDGWRGRDDRSTLLPPTKNDTPPVKPDATSPRPVSATLPPAAEPKDDRPRWAGPGTLTRSALALDGRRTYAIESSPGVVKLYVVGASGVDLDRHVGRRVDVYGSVYSRKDLSKPYVVAAQVEQSP